MSQADSPNAKILSTSTIEVPIDGPGVQTCLTQCLSALTSILNDDKAITKEQTEALVGAKHNISYALRKLRSIAAVDNNLNDILSFVNEEWRRYEIGYTAEYYIPCDEEYYFEDKVIHKQITQVLDTALDTLWAFSAVPEQLRDASKSVGNCVQEPDIGIRRLPADAWIKTMLEQKVDERCQSAEQLLQTLTTNPRDVSRQLGNADRCIRESAVTWERTRHDIVTRVLTGLDDSMTVLATGRRSDSEE